jgi:tetratricopeptide (TPR) repeat protein
LISEAHALHPEDARLANTYAVLQMRRPEFRYREQGFEIARAAIAAGVEDRFVYGNLWGRLVEVGRFEEAEQVNSRRERLYTAPGALERLRADSAPFVHLMRGEHAKADEGFTRRFAASPPREESHFWPWARAKTGLGQHDQAVAILRDGLKLLPRNCLLWQELGSAQAARGRPEDITSALATFDQGIAAVPKCGLTTNAAARLLIALGRPAEARAKLDALIKIAPHSDGAVIAKELLASLPAKP